VNRRAAEEWVARYFVLVAAGIYLCISIALFSDALFSSGKIVIGGAESDVGQYFLPLRKFGFEQWKNTGRAPGWNPYVFSGTPFVANFQTAMWYPPNWVHFFVSPATGINWMVALHVALAGWATAMWCRLRGIGILGSIVGGVILMLSGGYLPRVILGHVTVLCASPWSVVLFLALEGMFKDRRARWVILGIVAVGMSILAGHPQTTYCALMLAGIYTLVQLLRTHERLRIAGAGLAMVVSGCLLAGVQLFPGWKLAGESIRGAGVGYEFSKQNFLPVENLLTLFDARVFGSRIDPFYCGRGVFPETSVFVGACGVVLAMMGVAGAGGKRRWDLLALAAISLVLALGAQTPVHWVLYHALPGYATFRGTIRFDFMVDLFLAVLAAGGVDAILNGQRPAWWMVAVGAGLAVLALAAGGWLAGDAARGEASAWARIFSGWSAGSRLPDLLIKNPQCVTRWGEFIAGRLMISGVVLGVATIGLAMARRWRWPAYGLAALAVGEVLMASSFFVVSGPGEPYYPTIWTHAIQRSPDDRVLYASMSGILEFDDQYLGVKWIGARLNSNYGLWRREEDAYGYDPVILARYARFIAACQGLATERIDWTPVVWVAGEGFNLVRVNNVFRFEGVSPVVEELGSAVPRAQVVSSWEVKKAEEILKIMSKGGFEVGKLVLLEESPGIGKIANGKPGGTVNVIQRSSDEMEIEAQVEAPGVLLVSDTYAPGWEAQALEGSAQKEYRVMPADYVLRGIPLGVAGRHHLRLFYRAPGMEAGAVASLVMVAGISGAMIVALFRRKLARARL